MDNVGVLHVYCTPLWVMWVYFTSTARPYGYCGCTSHLWHTPMGNVGVFNEYCTLLWVMWVYLMSTAHPHGYCGCTSQVLHTCMSTVDIVTVHFMSTEPPRYRGYCRGTSRVPHALMRTMGVLNAYCTSLWVMWVYLTSTAHPYGYCGW